MGGCHPPSPSHTLPPPPPLLSACLSHPLLQLQLSPPATAPSIAPAGPGAGWLPAVSSPGCFTGPSVLLTPLHKVPSAKPLPVGTAKRAICFLPGGWRAPQSLGSKQPSGGRRAWQPPQPPPRCLSRCSFERLSSQQQPLGPAVRLIHLPNPRAKNAASEEAPMPVLAND